MASRSGERQFSYADFCVEDQDGRVEIVVSELQAFVTGLVRGHIENAMKGIVDDLNSLGHQLELDGYDVAGFSYADCSRAADEKRLRLSIDFTVSAGFEPPHPEQVRRSKAE